MQRYGITLGEDDVERAKRIQERYGSESISAAIRLALYVMDIAEITVRATVQDGVIRLPAGEDSAGKSQPS